MCKYCTAVHRQGSLVDTFLVEGLPHLFAVQVAKDTPMTRVVLASDRVGWERAYAMQRAWLWLGKGLRSIRFLPAPVALCPAFSNIRPLLTRNEWYWLLDGLMDYRGRRWIENLALTRGSVLVINDRFRESLAGLQAYVATYR